MPASLWTCFSLKSGRRCISMNDRRVGYFTIATRSHFGASPSSCASTSATNTISAPIAASGPSGAYRSSASRPLMPRGRAVAVVGPVAVVHEVDHPHRAVFVGRRGGQRGRVVHVDLAVAGWRDLRHGRAPADPPPAPPRGAASPGPPSARRSGSGRSRGCRRPPSGWPAPRGTRWPTRTALPWPAARSRGGGASSRCRARCTCASVTAVTRRPSTSGRPSGVVALRRPERAVADAADHLAGRVRLGDRVGERPRRTRSRTPRPNRRPGTRGRRRRCRPSPTASESVTFARRSSSARKRSSASVRTTGLSDSGSTGITPPERAGHVDVHAGVEERVVRHGQLAGEHPGRLADVERAVVGGDDQRPPAGQVEGHRLRVLGVHPEALHEPARPGGRGAGAASSGRLLCGRRRATARGARGPRSGAARRAGAWSWSSTSGAPPSWARLRTSIGSSVEVVELPLVGQRHACGTARRPGRRRRRWRTPRLGPGGRVVEGAHQLPEVVRRTPGDDALDARADVGRHLDAQRQRRVLGAAEPAGQARTRRCRPRACCRGSGGRRSAPGRPPTGPSTTGSRSRPGQRVHLGERAAQLVGHGVLVDAGGGEQRGHEVDVRGRHLVDRGRGRRPVADADDREGHPRGLVVEVAPLLVQPAVGAEQLAVVGGPHQHGVGRSALGHRPAHPVERPVHLGVQAVVEVAVALRAPLVDAG